MDNLPIINCHYCQIPFFRTRKRRKSRKFCSRACYRLASRKFDERPYPQVWVNGEKKLLHRAIYEAATGEKLTSKEIIHHKDGNPYNRAFTNLEKLTGRAAHLHAHNYHRRNEWQPDGEIPF